MKWTRDQLLVEALKFSHRGDFFKNNNKAYKAAKRQGVLDEVCSHMISLRKKYSNEEILLEALKYKTRKEWKQNHSSTYRAAGYKKLLNIACAHMTLLVDHGKWDKEKVFLEAQKYFNVNTWKKENYGSYRAAQRLDILKEASIHMKRTGQTSLLEKEVLNFIREHYPSAKNKRFSFKNKKLPFKYLELDIYIPELNKGVEFNGTYWHGKGFKRSWTNNVEEYHEMKKNLFQSAGIVYIEIQENFWLTNRIEAEQEILKFIGENNGL